MIVLDAALKKQLKEKYSDEQVLVVPTQSVTWLGDKFTKADKNEYLVLTDMQLNGKYILRSSSEYNSAFQQIIPYCVVLNKDKTKFFINERKAGESRLVSMLSLGYGGHINPSDGRQNAILNGLSRELNEELSLPKHSKPKHIGYTRDLTSELTDHIGIIYELSVDDMRYTKVKEPEKMDGRWVSLDDLIDNYYLFEGWSRYLIDYYFSINRQL